MYIRPVPCTWSVACILIRRAIFHSESSSSLNSSISITRYKKLHRSIVLPAKLSTSATKIFRD